MFFEGDPDSVRKEMSNRVSLNNTQKSPINLIMNKQYLDGFEIQEYNSGWVNIETGEIGDFKNGKPKRKPLWQRLCGRAKTELYETELLGIMEVEHFVLFRSAGTQDASVYRKYNKFTGKTKSIWANSGGHSLHFDPNAWDKMQKFVEL